MKRLRDGLVDKFETIVKQEIINHNNAVLASNLAVNKLTEDLRESTQSLDSRIVKLENALQSMHQRLLEEDKEIRQCKKIISDVLGESKTVNERNVRLIDSLTSDCERGFSLIKQELKKTDCLYSELNSLSKEVENLKPTISADQVKLSLKLVGAIEKVKKDIQETPNGIKEMRDDFLKALDMVRVEYVGMSKELAICKKSDFIYEKMFEDVYSQLKKLTNR